MRALEDTPIFDDFSYMLAKSSSSANPAEIHGVLAGLICLGHKPEGKSWFDAVLKILEMQICPAPDQRDEMLGLYDLTSRQLDGFTGDFQLLLPNEKYTFAERALALSQWCRGFVYGLGARNGVIDNISTETSREALRSIIEIADLDFAKIEVSEADKAAYLGVVEFVRAAVMTLYGELASDTPEEPEEVLVYLH